ncbi:hypothetical protein N566_07910 [Streptomycetaceae bacterium MP113-05]|nr:hypothetical protein N566_07910 [Streptomycetaceae bacterium MP113-05]
MTTAHRAAEEHATPPPTDNHLSVTSWAPADEAAVQTYCRTCRKPLVDGLTGVLGRHEWDRRATAAVADARERGLPVALILIDLDSFKSVNDTYGHLAGDAVLRAVAGVLAGVARGIVGRYGGHAGDEFLVLLPGATGAEASEVARRTQTAVRALSVPARASRSATVTIDGQTASMGVAAETADAMASRADVLSDLLLDADVGLRAAKRGGGDLVCGVDAGADTSGVSGSSGEVTGTAVPRPRRPRGSGPVRPPHGGEVRIPLATFGHASAEGPDELVLSSAAAEHLHTVLGHMLGRGGLAAEEGAVK